MKKWLNDDGTEMTNDEMVDTLEEVIRANFLTAQSLMKIEKHKHLGEEMYNNSVFLMSVIRIRRLTDELISDSNKKNRETYVKEVSEIINKLNNK